MPSSYADYIRDWESLETAVADRVGELAGHEVHLAELQKARDEVKLVKAQQDLYAGARQKATQDLSVALERGKEAAVRLRGYVKAKLGPKNELLNRFGVAPEGAQLYRQPGSPPRSCGARAPGPCLRPCGASGKWGRPTWC